MRLCLVLLCCIFGLSALAQDTSAVGDWQGTLDAGGQKLRLAFHIQAGSTGTLSATMDSLDQGANGIPVASTVLKGKTLNLAIPNAGISYQGDLSDDGQQITGIFRQGPAELPLSLRKLSATEVKASGPKRPQIPQKPYPYDEQDVEFPNPAAEGVRIACTLTTPRGEGPFSAVGLLSGSGPHTRDQVNFGHPLGLVLADFLTRQGIAVLRCDDRGNGKSTAPRESLTSITYQDLASDASVMVQYLKENKKIKSGSIGLVGHSEGGVVAPLAAVSNADVNFLILLAGLGTTGETSILAQKEAILRISGLSPDVSADRAIYKAVLAGMDEETVRKTAAPIVGSLSSSARDNYFRMILSPYWKSMLAYDPVPTLSGLKIPVLALFGEKDLQVLPEVNAPPMREAAKSAKSEQITVEVVPGVNHLFQTARTGSPQEYSQIEETIAPAVLSRISEWLKARIQ